MSAVPAEPGVASGALAESDANPADAGSPSDGSGGPASSGTAEPAPAARARRRVARTDLWWAGGVGAALVAVDVVLRAYLRRPFWYDEIWRGHFVSEPLATFWPELAKANTPSAIGWVVVERLGGDVLGWHTWVLRLPGFVALPLLGIGITLLVGRFAGRLAGAFAALWICLNSTLLDLGTQLKPYTIETLAAVVAVLLWLADDRPLRGAGPGVGSSGAGSNIAAGPGTTAAAALGGPASGSRTGGEAHGSGGGRPHRLDRGRLARRTAAGVVGLFSVPAIFIIAPLAAADVILVAYATWAARRPDQPLDSRLVQPRDSGADLPLDSHGRDASPARPDGQQQSERAASPDWWHGRPAGVARPSEAVPAGQPETEARGIWSPGTWARARARARVALVAGAWRGAEALPALVLTAANTFFFVGHQSSQRLGHYWDAQFLAGRGLAGGLAFIARQVRDIVTGTPPGIDRYDPSLLHPPTDGSWTSYWVLAPAVVACGLAGVAVLARRHDGRLILLALGGAQLAMLAASAVRFWPFGPTRTNLFLVPLIVLVVVTGAVALMRRLAAAAHAAISGPAGQLRRTESGDTSLAGAPAAEIPIQGSALRAAAPREAVGPGESVGDASSGGSTSHVGPADPDGEAPAAPVASPRRGLGARRVGTIASAVVIVGVVAVAGTTAQISSASKDGRLYEQRDRLRGLDLTVDAAIAARRLYLPGDLVVVGGRLIRPGWIYSMEASDDAARRPADLPPRPAGATGEPPRIPRSDTVFFVQPGVGQVKAAVDARTPAPNRLLLFVFDLDATSARSDLADLRRSGWCPSGSYLFPQAGTLTVLTHCQPAAG
nr:hypothetical protein [Pseudofrankia inefficax]